MKISKINNLVELRNLLQNELLQNKEKIDKKLKKYQNTQLEININKKYFNLTKPIYCQFISQYLENHFHYQIYLNIEFIEEFDPCRYQYILIATLNISDYTL